MALGGGTFLTQNKVLPGAYINFVSVARASVNMSDRGYAAMALELDWGVDGEVFAVELADLQKESLKCFGYDYTSPKLKGLRDLFLNAKTLYAYRLNSGTKASNSIAEAKCSGIRGNDIKIIVSINIDNSEMFDVVTMMDGVEVDQQTVATIGSLADNDFVIFKKSAVLMATAGEPLTGGSNKNAITGLDYQTFLDKIEAFSFNTLGCLSTDETIKGLFVSFTKRMRDDQGVKFQTVIFEKPANYEGVVNLVSKITDEGENEASLVYYTTGAIAGCAVNKSLVNRTYDGEYTIDANVKQIALEKAIKSGEFIFHKDGDEVCILDDVNSFTDFTLDKNEDFSFNQVIRVLDQIGNDTAVLFRRYLGKVQNNESGRVSFWNDIVAYNRELQKLGAIQNFTAEDIIVAAGNSKNAVVVTNYVEPVSAMTKLYMTVYTS